MEEIKFYPGTIKVQGFTFEEQMQIMELRMKLGQKVKGEEIKMDSEIPLAEEIFFPEKKMSLDHPTSTDL